MGRLSAWAWIRARAALHPVPLRQTALHSEAVSRLNAVSDLQLLHEVHHAALPGLYRREWQSAIFLIAYASARDGARDPPPPLRQPFLSAR